MISRATTASDFDVVMLLALLPSTLLVMLLSVVALTYLWSSDADRRHRAGTLAALLVRPDGGGWVLGRRGEFRPMPAAAPANEDQRYDSGEEPVP